MRGIWHSEPMTDTADLLRDAAERATRYLAALEERPVTPSAAAVAALVDLGGALADQGSPAAETLALLDRCGSPATVATAGGRYFGFVTGGALPATVAAGWLAQAWDQNTALGVMSPATTTLDALALRWLVDVLGLPEGSGGAFVTGATMANISGLTAARNRQLALAGHDVDHDGLFGAPPLRVLVGGAAHASIFKALSVIGLGRSRVEVLPADEQGRVVADDLPALDRRPTIVCLQAGNVNTGASDPFEPLVAWAHEAGAWVHIDGAFGLWAAASRSRASQVQGVAAADSWATDAHKWLNVPYDCGAVVVADPTALPAAFDQQVSYLPVGDERDPARHGPEFSQRARGVEVWAALHHLGRSGVADLVDRCCDLAVRAAAGLRALGLEVHNEVVLNQVVFSAADDEATAELLGAIQAEGTAWMGPTTWRGRACVRLSVSSWATTEADIDATLAAIERVSARVE